MHRSRRTTVAALATVATLAASGPAMALDRALYGVLLERHTRAVADTAGTRVDYAALRADPDWRRLVDGLADADPAALASRDARLAFWIDVYNVLAIDWIVREGPVESIRDLGNFLRPVWKKTAGRVGGREVSLDEVEHRILRPMGEPRIHFAIVCASTSCPSLRREPFRPDRLDAQLDAQTRAFLADPRKGLAIDRDEEDVRVSKIFDWFAEDFGGDAGVVAFVTRHAPETDRPWLTEHADELDLVHLPYDWEVNALPGRR
jgi:hypothetical protein